MGVLLQGNFGRSSTVELTKKQLSQHPRIRRSTRWIEQQVAKGMPSRMDGNRRMFPLYDVLAWLDRRERGAA
jgi:hypothetical protein